jgi:hypothetical protein
VTAGILQVGVNGVGTTGTGATTVAAGATISGSGTINGDDDTTNHVLNGTLKPGDNNGALNGILTVKGNLDATSVTSAFDFDITSPTGTWAAFLATSPSLPTPVNPITGDAHDDLDTSTTDQGDYDTRIAALADYYRDRDPTSAGAHDKLKVLGTLTINGSTTISVNDVGATLVAGEVFNIIDANNFVTVGFDTGGDERVGGTVGNLILPTLDAAYFWDTSKFLTHGLLIVVDPPAYWNGGGTAAGSDPTSWHDLGNWVHGDGSAVTAIDASMHLIVSAPNSAKENRMLLNSDMAIRQLTIDDTEETTLSGNGTLKIAPVVDDGTAHNAIVVKSGAGTARISTDLVLSEGARITVDNASTPQDPAGLVLQGEISAKKTLIKAGSGTLALDSATMTIGALAGSTAENLDIKFEGTGGLLIFDTTFTLDLFGSGGSDKIVFIGTVEGNDVALQDVNFVATASDDAEFKDGEVFDLIDWVNLGDFQMSFTGDIADYFNLPTLGEGQSWGYDRFALEGVIYVVPEPSRAMLLLGAFVLMHLRRRRR